MNTFLLSIGMGCLLCALYDVTRAWHKAGFSSFWSVFFTDIIFWVLSAFITFIFYISRTNGEIRGYVLIGEILGFVLFRISISKILFYILSNAFVFVNKISKIVSAKINVFYIKSEKVILKTFSHIIKNFKKCKKLLKIRSKLLYTNENNTSTEKVLNETKT